MSNKLKILIPAAIIISIFAGMTLAGAAKKTIQDF